MKQSVNEIIPHYQYPEYPVTTVQIIPKGWCVAIPAYISKSGKNEPITKFYDCPVDACREYFESQKI